MRMLFMRAAVLLAASIGGVTMIGAAEKAVKAEVVEMERIEGKAQTIGFEFEERGSTKTVRNVDVTRLGEGFRKSVVLGSTVSIRYVCGGGPEACTALRGRVVEEREAFAASFFYGYAMDTFAADELNRYLNPDDSGDVEERFVGGFDFEYRLRSQKGGRGWWIYGETLHGVRSADIDCAAPENEGLSPCTESGFDPNNPGEQTLYILRNATSLEAFIGFRYEFLPFNRWTNHPATLYAVLQFGFLTVSDNAGDVVDNRHGGLGMMLTSGRFAGSYLEVGFGTNDLFLENSNRRYMIDGFLTFESTILGKVGVRPFAQMTCDFDMDRGSDSIQSYFGLDFDLDRLFGREEG